METLFTDRSALHDDEGNLPAHGARPAKSWVAGVDGCSTGWIVVLREVTQGQVIARVVTDFAAVLALPEAPKVIGIDIPIGLLDVAVSRGRTCEAAARQLLRGRTSSVFSSPTRAAVAAWRAGGDYTTVSIANRGGNPRSPGLSKQAFAIVPKISEVDAVLAPNHQHVVREVHPELCFAEANGGTPMANSKKDLPGRDQRVKVLARVGFTEPLRLLGDRLPKGVKPDDVLDACIACWTAERVTLGTARVLSATPPTDKRGLKMELWR